MNRIRLFCSVVLISCSMFSLVCQAWSDADFSNPVRINDRVIEKGMNGAKVRLEIGPPDRSVVSSYGINGTSNVYKWYYRLDDKVVILTMRLGKVFKVRSVQR